MQNAINERGYNISKRRNGLNIGYQWGWAILLESWTGEYAASSVSGLFTIEIDRHFRKNKTIIYSDYKGSTTATKSKSDIRSERKFIRTTN